MISQPRGRFSCPQNLLLESSEAVVFTKIEQLGKSLCERSLFNGDIKVSPLERLFFCYANEFS